MRKIGIYGGTFNPIHNGHIYVAEQFAQRLGLDRVIFIPTHVPPHKQATDLAPAQDRLAMCRAALPHALFEVNDTEIRRDGKSFTSDTLRELKHSNPADELYLLMGEDMFLTVQDWHEPQTIFSIAVLCAAPRSIDGLARLLGHAKLLNHLGAKTIVQNIEYLPVSSTMVRAAVKCGNRIDDFVPPAVAAYIAEKGLYLECGK